MASIALLFKFLPALTDLRIGWQPAAFGVLRTLSDALGAPSLAWKCAEQRQTTDWTLHRRWFSLTIPGLSSVGSSYAAVPPLRDCSPCSWLDVVLPHLSTYSCSRLGCFGHFASLNILGGGDHPHTPGSREAACSGPRCDQSVGNCNIGSDHF
jgi:hypothetical protein